MRLTESVMEGLKSTLSHNTAQKLIQDKQLGKAYLLDVEFLLRNMGLEADQLDSLLTFARLKSRAEVKTLQAMYKRYGIDPKVAGHGGSEISLQTLIEMAVAKEEN